MSRKVALALATLLAGAAGVAAGRSVTLVSVVGEKGETTLAAPLRGNERVGLGFVHSSEGVRVASWFRAAGGHLEAMETEMEGFGPGLEGVEARLDHAPAFGSSDTGGYRARARGQAGSEPQEGERPRLVLEGGPQVRWVDLRVGRTTGHWVAVGTQRMDLSALVPQGRTSYRFSLRVRRVPVGAVWVSGAVFRLLAPRRPPATAAR